ncbi:hypothetical protein SAMN04487981_110169 [Streptomyces sp. cf386]|nr:hypothetical protein SAMN04487981_110169 [Streptomyces sp. cf386]
MRHPIARRFFEPLLRRLRTRTRPKRYACRCLNGPTVHHTGSRPRPPQTPSPLAVPGIGIGSCGMPSVVVGGAR